MTTLLDHIRRQIALEGPMSIADYMALALSHPRYGYYATRDPFGVSGDFITAPEVSQMFGELLGLWAAQVWLDLGGPARISLMELGPGRGTLMADALRATRILPGFHDCLEVHLVETSPTLKARQKAALETTGIKVHWHDTVDAALSASTGPLLVLANEFFDALPIRQFVRTENGWHERMVGLDKDDRLTFVIGPERIPGDLFLPGTLSGAPIGAIVEHCPAAQAIMSSVADAISTRTGASLIIDYGYTESTAGDSFQAVRAHKPCPVLDSPGDVDLTAHVDFEMLAGAAGAADAVVYGPVEQSAFLTTLGIRDRARRLLQSASPDQQRDIDAALHRLTSADEMGSLFKVLGCAGQRQPPLPGLPKSTGSATPSVS